LLLNEQAPRHRRKDQGSASKNYLLEGAEFVVSFWPVSGWDFNIHFSKKNILYGKIKPKLPRLET
jgi:hypothetical protein